MAHRRTAGAIALGVALAALAAAPAAATTAGTNGALVWQRESPSAPPALWVANPDGTQARQVLDQGDVVTFEAAWSPVNATTIAFTHYDGAPFGEEIYLGDLATGDVRPLTNGRAAAIAPTFSPDGTRVAFFSVAPPTGDRPPVARITTVNADGGGRRVITPADRDSIDPDFSPDGTRILYTEGLETGPNTFDNRLAVMNADGSGRRALTPSGGRWEINGRWTPDGRSIVFESTTRRRLGSDIEIMAADGSGRRKLLATTAFETNPIPSPDGTRIAFTSDRDRRGPVRLGPGTELYTMAADGTDVLRLTRNRVPDIFPDWQRLP